MRRHVIMCQRQFVPQILAGTKPHTIRGQRKRAIQPGDLLDLRAWTGKPYRSKQEKLREVVCIQITPIRICVDFSAHTYVKLGDRFLDIYALKALAIRDGFKDDAEFFRFFRDTHGPKFEGQLIEWKA